MKYKKPVNIIYGPNFWKCSAVILSVLFIILASLVDLWIRLVQIFREDLGTKWNCTKTGWRFMLKSSFAFCFLMIKNSMLHAFFVLSLVKSDSFYLTPAWHLLTFRFLWCLKILCFDIYGILIYLTYGIQVMMKMETVNNTRKKM